jgi:hypothetical protein
MIDLIIILIALLISGWMVAPPRAEQRSGLVAGLVVIWGALVAVGLRRGVLAGFEAWLVVLALMAAIAGLLVVWSTVNLRRAGQTESGEEHPE